MTRTSSWIYPPKVEKSPLPVTLAVNEFSKFFSVRGNNIRLRPGEEVTLRIKQVQHVATENYRALGLDTRQCRKANMHTAESFAYIEDGTTFSI